MAASVNSELVVSGAADMADAISAGNHTLLNVFSHVDLNFSSGQLTVTSRSAPQQRVQISPRTPGQKRRGRRVRQMAHAIFLV